MRDFHAKLKTSFLGLWGAREGVSRERTHWTSKISKQKAERP